MPLTKDTPTGEIIKDFEKSKNPKFAGKSKEKRRQMAIAASYKVHGESFSEPVTLKKLREQLTEKKHIIIRKNPETGYEEKMVHFGALNDIPAGWELAEAYSPSNPKIDLHDKTTGKYIASTNWSPNVKHAVSSYEEKNPHMAGKVKGYINKK